MTTQMNRIIGLLTITLILRWVWFMFLKVSSENILYYFMLHRKMIGKHMKMMYFA